MQTPTITRSEPVAFSLDEIRLHYVNLGNPITPAYNGERDNPQWSVQIRGLNDDAITQLEGLGFHLSTDDSTGERGFTMKQYTQNSKGLAREIKVYDVDGNILSLEDRQTIGMNTLASVRGFMFAYQTSDGRSGVSVRLTDVLVIEKEERAAMTDEQNFINKFGAMAAKFKQSQESNEVLEDI